MERSTHSCSPCRPSPTGPSTTDGMPAAVRREESIHALIPPSSASIPVTLLKAPGKRLHHGRSPRHLHGVPEEDGAHVRFEGRVGMCKPEKLFSQVLLHSVCRFSGDSSSLDSHTAGRRVGGQFLSAADQGRMHGSGPQDGMGGAGESRQPMSSMATRTRPILAIASTPMSGREPCAATPRVSISSQEKPL